MDDEAAAEAESPLRCPACGSVLLVSSDSFSCPCCDTRWPVVDGIPRFVPADNYADSFGFQWRRHARTQIDRFNGLTISRDRFFAQTRWTRDELGGRTVLECGSGAGRFTQIAADAGARVWTIDYSGAIDANAENNRGRGSVFFAQASLFEMPFAKDWFDFLFCFGVIQHTPDPPAAIRAMIAHLGPGGRFCFDVYASPISYLHPRHLLRPLTRHVKKERLYRHVERWVPRLLPLSTALHKLPVAGEYLARLVPVANWRRNIRLPDEAMYREWAVLDTFDWLSPAYEKPQTRRALERALRPLPVEDVEIFRSRGLYVVRGCKGVGQRS